MGAMRVRVRVGAEEIEAVLAHIPARLYQSCEMARSQVRSLRQALLGAGAGTGQAGLCVAREVRMRVVVSWDVNGFAARSTPSLIQLSLS